MDFSIIVPSYNEEENIEAFLSETTRTFDAQDFTYEIIFVDDGSKDNTLAVLKKLAQARKFENSGDIRVISFSRNFGKEAGLFAGMQAARGSCMGCIDADLQQSPQTMLEMYNILREDENCDCVAAVQVKRKENFIRKALKEAFYKIYSSTMETEIIRDASDFRVFRRIVANALLEMKESYRFSKGLFSWVGFHTRTIEYEPKARRCGKSSWSLRDLFSYAINGITAFTTFPLRAVFWLGFFAAAVAIINLIVVLVEYASGVEAPSGYPTIVCLVLLFGGFLLLGLGIVGDYLGRAYIEGKNRPIYITREEFSLNEEGFGVQACAGGEGSGAHECKRVAGSGSGGGVGRGRRWAASAQTLSSTHDPH